MESVSLFLILSILSVSCRFTPCLINRYGSCQAAADYFIKHASSLVSDAMYETTLENTQAFFLLALAQWGCGNKKRSSVRWRKAFDISGLLTAHKIHMGIAVRSELNAQDASEEHSPAAVAGILRLHREETYSLPENATTDEIVQMEIARRTFWVLERRYRPRIFLGSDTDIRPHSRGQPPLQPCVSGAIWA